MPIAKVLENDYIARTLSGTVMAARSPYVKRVNVLLLLQSGIIEMWKISYDRKLPTNAISNFSCLNRSKESQELLWKLFFNYYHWILIIYFYVLYRSLCTL